MIASSGATSIFHRILVDTAFYNDNNGVCVPLLTLYVGSQ